MGDELNLKEQMEVDFLKEHTYVEINAMFNELNSKLTVARENLDKLSKCTRVEVIDKNGRSYTNYDCKTVETQLQDDERTLKVFIS